MNKLNVHYTMPRLKYFMSSIFKYSIGLKKFKKVSVI